MGKRKTNDEFIEELKIKNPTIVPLEEYITSSTKIKFLCTVCGHIWYCQPASLLNGHGCPECAKRKMTYTKEQVQKMIDELGTGIKITGDYVNTTTKTEAECRKKHKWKVRPGQLLEGFGCPECQRENATKTHEQYLLELKEKNINIKPLEPYIQALTPIFHECGECGHKWKSTPDNILHGHGCPNCVINNRLIPFEDFLKRLNEEMPEVEFAGEFINMTTETEFRCKICGHEWSNTPSGILSGHKGCYYCGKKRAGEKLRSSNEEFIKKLNKINPHIKPLEEYVTSRDPILTECLLCGNIWSPTPNSLLNNVGCPACSTSVGERMVRTYLEKYNINFESQKKFDGLVGIGNGLLSYDFYLLKYNLLIEYQGIQHFKPIEYFGGEKQFKVQQIHDRRKRAYARIKGYNLLEIRYDEDVTQKLDNYFNNFKLECVETVIEYTVM